MAGIYKKFDEKFKNEDENFFHAVRSKDFFLDFGFLYFGDRPLTLIEVNTIAAVPLTKHGCMQQLPMQAIL